MNQKKLPETKKLITFLNYEASEAIFQLEKGKKEGKLHYQGVFTLQGKRDSKKGVLNRFGERFKNVSGLTLSPTYNKLASSSYVTKEETRVEGPFYCGKSERYDPKYGEKKLSDWQHLLYQSFFTDEAEACRGRNVITMHDSEGRSGKSEFVKWLRVGQKKLVVRKLPVASVQQLNAAVFKITEKIKVDIFLIDITRSLGQDQNLKDLFSSLEDVINGFVVDVMFGKYKEAIFDPPLILIMTNYKFDEIKSYMSADRWVPLGLDEKKNLVDIPQDEFGKPKRFMSLSGGRLASKRRWKKLQEMRRNVEQK